MLKKSIVKKLEKVFKIIVAVIFAFSTINFISAESNDGNTLTFDVAGKVVEQADESNQLKITMTLANKSEQDITVDSIKTDIVKGIEYVEKTDETKPQKEGDSLIWKDIAIASNQEVKLSYYINVFKDLSFDNMSWYVNGNKVKEVTDLKDILSQEDLDTFKVKEVKEVENDKQESQQQEDATKQETGIQEDQTTTPKKASPRAVGDIVEVRTAEELKSYLEGGLDITVKLMEDIEIPFTSGNEFIYINEDNNSGQRNVTLDLNGHKINVKYADEVTNARPFIKIVNGSVLNVIDSNPNASNTLNGANYNGGIISGARTVFRVENSTLNINAGNYVENKTTENGAVISSDKSTININGQTLISKNEAKTGGAIYASGESTLNIDGVTISHNKAVCKTYGPENNGRQEGGEGGAIYASSNKIILTISNSTVSNNEAKTGGALFANIKNLTIKNSTFSNNNAKTVTTVNSKGENVTDGGNGGAIYSWPGEDSGAQISISGNSEFSNNKSEKSGGAIFVNNPNLTIDNAKFSNNQANDYGGGLYISGISNATISNSNTSIDHNTANLRGGGIYVGWKAIVTLNNGKIEYNESHNSSTTDGGGGIRLDGDAQFVMYDGVISNNKTEKGSGGGIRAGFYGGDNVKIKISGGKFEKNEATGEGGAISVGQGCYAEIIAAAGKTIEIKNNKSTGVQDWGGGGLFCANGGVMHITNLLVENNKAGGFGGGLAGCSTGRVFDFSSAGGAIFDNSAEGKNLSGSESAKNEDHAYTEGNQVFHRAGYQDYFCALNSVIDNKMLGGGYEQWTGSADNNLVNYVDASEEDREKPLYSTFLTGLSANPTNEDKGLARDEAQVIVTGNSAYTHGGGILCNGYLIIGNVPGELKLGDRLLINAQKGVKESDGTTTIDGQHTNNTFNFELIEIVDNKVNVISTMSSINQTNDTSKGDINIAIPFEIEDNKTTTTKVYYLREKATSTDANYTIDDAVYKIIIRGEKKDESVVVGGETVPIVYHKITSIKDDSDNDLKAVQIIKGTLNENNVFVPDSSITSTGDNAEPGDITEYCGLDLDYGNNHAKYVFINTNTVKKETDETNGYEFKYAENDTNHDHVLDVTNKGDAFTNTYTEPRASLKLRKSFAGAVLSENEKKNIKFTITCLEDEDFIKEVYYAEFKNGEYTINNLKAGTYIVKESKADKAGYSLTKTYKLVGKDGNNSNNVIISEENTTKKETITLEITNTYAPTQSFEVEKVLTGRKWKKGDTFTFNLEADSAIPVDSIAMPKDSTVSISNESTEKKAQFEAIAFNKAGEYKFTVTEVKGTIGGITYSDKKVEYKVVVGADENGSLTIKSVTSNVIKGKNDTSEGTVFTNSYKAENTTKRLEVEKNLTGRGWKEGDTFTFELKADSTIPAGSIEMPKDSTVSISDESTEKKAQFEAITFKKAGEYKFIVTEVKGNIDGITYSDKKVEYTVVVEDDENGSLTIKSLTSNVTKGTDDTSDGTVFTNSYKTGNTTKRLEVEKNLTGREWKEGDTFTFELKADSAIPAGSIEMPDNKTAVISNESAEKKAQFEAITFNKAGEYKFIVTEVKGSIGGITYSDKVLTYTIKVTDDGKGNLTAGAPVLSVDTTKNDNTVNNVFTNTYSTGETTQSFEVKKVLTGREWKDEESFTLQMVAGNSDTEKAINEDKVVVLSKENVEIKKDTNNHKVSFGNITFKKAGTYVFNVTENGTSGNGLTYSDKVLTYTIKVTDDGNGNLTAGAPVLSVDTTKNDNTANNVFTNTYTASETTAKISGTKVYAPGMKTGQFTFKLVETDKDGNVLENGTKLTTTNDAKGDFSFDEITYNTKGTYYYNVSEVNGGKTINEITYDNSVIKVIVTVEDNGNGQLTTSVDKNAKEVKFTNTFNEGTTEVSGTKTWVNVPNDLKRPTVTIKLLQDGKEFRTTTIENGQTSYKFENLPKYKTDGTEYEYTVNEVPISGYETTQNGNNFVNTNVETIDVSGTKTWVDNNNQDGVRPTSITVNLHANGKFVTSKIISAQDGWKYSFTNLPKYENGKEIEYTFVEDAIPNYSTKIEGYDITNTHTPGKISVTVSKAWDDANNQDGKRPTSVKVQLLANGENSGEVVTLNAENNWRYTWENLAQKSNGKDIEYTVNELSVEGYSTAITGSATKGYVITNTYEPETININGEKVWEDNNNQDGVRPASIVVNLRANGKLVASKTISAANDWKYSFTNLPKYENGVEIVYTFTEDAIPNYSTRIEGYDIINTHTPGKTSLTVNKAWNDANDQDGIRPTSVQVKLLADGVEKETVTLDASNNWTYTWQELDQKSGGNDIKYTVQEVSVDKYVSEITGDATKGYTITNTHTPATVNVNGTKTWNDANNQDGVRPTSVIVNLFADGKFVKNTTVNANTDWKYSFNNLPKYADGNEIKYTITENPVDKYTPDIKGYDITNTHTPETATVSGSKTWVDNDNQDGVRPTSIIVNLLADGKLVDSKTVTKDDNWSWSFDNLPKYADGVEIKYTVTENTVDNYTPEIKGYDITNTHTPGKTSVTVTKAWDDANNQDGIRPTSVQVQLLADGVVKETVTLDDSNNWTYIWTGLDQKSAGNEIKYEVQEVPVQGYTTAISSDATNGYTITNTHEIEKTSVSGVKTWQDGNNEAGQRPTKITVNLLANGVKVASKDITAKDGWKYSFNDLDKYADGKKITYTVSENVVPNYTTRINGYDITNIYTPVKVRPDLVIYKVDQDGNFLPGAAFELVKIENDDEKVIGTQSEGPKFEFKGLEDGIYRVYETVVPEGYEGLTGPFEFEVIKGNIYYDEELTQTFTVYNTNDGTEPGVLGDEIDEEDYDKWVEGQEVDKKVKTSDDQQIFGYGGMSILSIAALYILRKKRLTKH